MSVVPKVMHGQEMACPLCSSTGHADPSCTLTLKQVNATEAIYVCNNSECTYPVGEEVIIVKRTISELLSDSQDDAIVTSPATQERDYKAQCKNFRGRTNHSCQCSAVGPPIIFSLWEDS